MRPCRTTRIPRSPDRATKLRPSSHTNPTLARQRRRNELRQRLWVWGQIKRDPPGSHHWASRGKEKGRLCNRPLHAGRTNVEESKKESISERTRLSRLNEERRVSKEIMSHQAGLGPPKWRVRGAHFRDCEASSLTLHPHKI